MAILSLTSCLNAVTQERALSPLLPPPRASNTRTGDIPVPGHTEIMSSMRGRLDVVPHSRGVQSYRFRRSRDIASCPDRPTDRRIRVVESAREPAASVPVTVFEIQNIPPYSALSYTWGNPLPSEGSDDDVPWLKESYSIDCNGYSVGITPNLFEGLISLAEMGYSMATSGLTLFASIKKLLQSEILRSL